MQIYIGYTNDNIQYPFPQDVFQYFHTSLSIVVSQVVFADTYGVGSVCYTAGIYLLLLAAVDQPYNMSMFLIYLL